ncbi:MAG: pantoate--beta-alanine ligase [Granulosicoccus sp.]|jgi:pantoate--beta-alanine ligase
MQITNYCSQLNELLQSTRKSGGLIHFVPTMGALHEGHVSLVKAAQAENAIVVVSVFVNPAQFNNPTDLVNYPKTLNHDKVLLEDSGCDIMFVPTEHEIYPKGALAVFDLAGLDQTMEGMYRPGHFQGVVQVVHRFLEIMAPDAAFFGQKDFQQLTIVRHSMKSLGHSCIIEGCSTVREVSGLAMSSRNMLLSDLGRDNAKFIYQSLVIIKKAFANGESVSESMEKCKDSFAKIEGVELEYLEVVDPITLRPIEGDKNKHAVACVAAFVEGVRLIDNISLFA